MASTILYGYLPGLTLSAILRPLASMTTSETVSLTESGTEAGQYSGSTALVNATYAVEIQSGSTKVADDVVVLGADAGTYRIGDSSGIASIMATLDKIPQAGKSHRYTQLAETTTTTDVSVSVIP